jgi:hypothetical protein
VNGKCFKIYIVGCGGFHHLYLEVDTIGCATAQYLLFTVVEDNLDLQKIISG